MARPPAADRGDQRLGSHLGPHNDIWICGARFRKTPGALFNGDHSVARDGLRFRRHIDFDAVSYGRAALSSATARFAALVASLWNRLGAAASGWRPGVSLLRSAAHIEAASPPTRGRRSAKYNASTRARRRQMDAL